MGKRVKKSSKITKLVEKIDKKINNSRHEADYFGVYFIGYLIIMFFAFKVMI